MHYYTREFDKRKKVFVHDEEAGILTGIWKAAGRRDDARDFKNILKVSTAKILKQKGNLLERKEYKNIGLIF